MRKDEKITDDEVLDSCKEFNNRYDVCIADSSSITTHKVDHDKYKESRDRGDKIFTETEDKMH